MIGEAIKLSTDQRSPLLSMKFMCEVGFELQHSASTKMNEMALSVSPTASIQKVAAM